MTASVTRGNISAEQMGLIKKQAHDANGRKRSGPKPPGINKPKARFEFFTGPNGKDYGPAIIHKEMQRYAYTPQGNKFFRELQKQQKEQMSLHKNTGLVPPPKPSPFDVLKHLFKKGK